MEFPGGLAVKDPGGHCCGLGSVPDLRTNFHMPWAQPPPPTPHFGFHDVSWCIFPLEEMKSLLTVLVFVLYSIVRMLASFI